MNATNTCGCCEGIAIAVPQDTSNRPGLPALCYRVGTHATFLETMIARLSSQDYPALAALKTRDPADPSIALLDCWALVADVLAFYQERIANEGYLRTATERLSVLELANLIGYRLRPGVASSVYLAYTLSQDLSKTPPVPTETLIPAGSSAQSVPGPGQLPQTFETSDALDARSAWNTLLPRPTQPQLFTAGVAASTDIATRTTVYFSGTSTKLNPGDALILSIDDATDQTPSNQALRLVQSVAAQNDQQRTLVTLQPPVASVSAEIAFAVAASAPAPVPSPAASVISAAVAPYLNEAGNQFSGSSLAAQAAALLSNPAPNIPPGLLEKVSSSGALSGSAAVQLVQQTAQEIHDLHALAVKRKFARLKPWLAKLEKTLKGLAPRLAGLPATARAVAASDAARAVAEPGRGSLLLNELTGLLPSLVLPPSLQPQNSQRLARSVGQTFSSQSDMAPRLIGAFLPAAAPILYKAWANVTSPADVTEVGAVRIKAGLFPGNYPGLPSSSTTLPTASVSGTTTTTFPNSPTLGSDWSSLYTEEGPLATIALDGAYDKIVAGTWIMIDRPHYPNPNQSPSDTPDGRAQTFHKVASAATASMTTSDSGFTAKVTQLTLETPWLGDAKALDLRGLFIQTGLLHGTVVYAQADLLPLAEETITTSVQGNTIELDDVYSGLESGRWIAVSGNRTDIPNVTGVSASEVVMILGVAQAANVAATANSPGTRPGAVHSILTLANSLAYQYDITTTAIWGNVVKATNGATRNEVLGNGDSSQAFQQFTLKQKPLTFVPASNPTGVDTTLGVYVNNIEWQETDTLAGLGAKDRDYLTQIADDQSTTLTFGNGRAGARLPTGSGNVTAIYRFGIGQGGNVGAGQISLLQSRPLNVTAVTNPLGASGGADPDSRDQARQNAPLAVLSLDRLVSVQDYADFARTFAGIGKASSTRLSNGQRDLVYVTIAGADDIPIDVTSDLYANLVQALGVNGDPYLPIQVAVRSLKLLVISAQVKILPTYLWEPVVAAIRAALLATFSFAVRDLGQPVFRSEVISAIQGVPGVAYVHLKTFDSVAQTVTAAELTGLADTLGLKEVIHAKLARINRKPANPPADSILAAELIYLSADLPDTLIVNQVTS